MFLIFYICVKNKIFINGIFHATSLERRDLTLNTSVHLVSLNTPQLIGPLRVYLKMAPVPEN